jgi:hypothetical protein
VLITTGISCESVDNVEVDALLCATSKAYQKRDCIHLQMLQFSEEKCVALQRNKKTEAQIEKAAASSSKTTRK